ncbi:RagB/SusD domain-containing protein [Gemmatirosa kalamazoonensis]|uniref:RagB/SusD domain-containing protein n=1 Tax=Gemmatirosa kalamazoonensis TaxID=861299 RepID=W0RGB4_9BACT|nr:RagB/SusD family nutrient uptake outer membrane protein [Gemmatirosa kalamazoonensis]AHG89370.1 RagB/SusD domain-containing protein [Gemmatirosa kalamazoonensis]
MRHSRMVRHGALAAAIALGASCHDYLTVTNPGPIADESLQTPDAVPGFVTGMSSDLSNALDEVVRISGIASDELGHGGSYTGEGLWYRGIINPEDINDQWALMQRARWVAEQGITRMKALPGFTYDNDAASARANLLAGFADRLLGENACKAVIDGGAVQSDSVHFQRALAYFTEAIRIAQARNVVDVLNAAYGGRASVKASLGDWPGAVADAQQVPAAFVYNAVYSTNSTRENNSLVQETYVRREFTVFGTQWAQVFNDPRVPWDTIYTSAAKTAVQKGQDGKTNFFRQRKYTDLGADIPLTKGTEMLMLRAEAALRTGDIGGAFALINQQRTVYRLPALSPPPAGLAAAWQILEKEYGAVVWLEGRRLWQLRRWQAATDASHNGFLDGRATCIPISLAERQSNPNASGG